MMKKFKDLVTANGVFSDGDWVESKDQNPNGDVRLIQLADIGVGTFIDKSNRFMTSEKAEELKCTYLEEGDILIARMPDPIGRACIFPELNTKCVTVVDICIVRPASDEIDSRWLMHLINSERFNNQILKFVTGTTRQRISRGNLAKLDVEVPPLEKQKRIAAILDKADNVRRKRQQAIDLADDFLRSVFLDMFGDPVTNPMDWEVKPLKQLCNIKGGGTPSKSNDSFWGGDIPWVSPKDMKSLYISSSKDKITSEAIKGSSTKLIDTDSVLMVVRSGVLKHTVPLALTTKPVSINQDMKAFSCRADLNSHYLLFCLKAFSQFLLGTVRGTTADNLSSDVINNLSVPVPPIEMQEKFASIALKQQSTKAKSKNSNDLSLLSFNSLSQKAFVGEL